MSKSERGLQLGVIGTALGAVLFGLVNSADASVTSPVDYPNVKISDGNATGGHLAFDPSDPKRLIVGINSGTGCRVKSSIDGGGNIGGFRCYCHSHQAQFAGVMRGMDPLFRLLNGW